MKKIYLLLLVAFVITNVKAQKKATGIELQPKTGALQSPQNVIAGACNILNYPAPTSWGTKTLYVYDVSRPLDSGYVTGTNFYADLQKAQFFNASSTTDTYITEAYIGFGNAYSSNKNKTVPIHVYAADGTAGGPGTLLGTATLVMKDIMNDVTANFYTDVVFNPVIALPASKKFYVSIDLTGLDWFASPADTLAVYSSKANKASGAWERYYTSATTSDWASFAANYNNFDVALYIYPFLSENQTCTVLPVHLISFNAQAKGKDVLLNWQVAQEVGMKEYGVERAGSDLRFVPAGTVPATNSSLNHTYGYTDLNALSAGTILYYRLKQVDNDGKISYSNIITIPYSSSDLSVKVVNPFKNVVQLQINTPYAQKMQGAIYDLQGRKITTAKEQVLVAGQNTVAIPTGLLPKGIYMLNITVGKTTFKYKILN